MPRDKSISHEKIIRAASEEFTEYGYDKASMRRIGRRCGLTAAALYRHFESKEALFDALVESAVNDLNEWVSVHMANSEAAVKAFASDPGSKEADGLWSSTEIDMMKELVYPRMTEYALLINRSHGSKYENFLASMVDKILLNMMPYFIQLKECGLNVKDISEAELRMLITAYCSALFEPVVQAYSMDEAVSYLDTVEAFFMPGWRALLGFAPV